MGMIPRDDQGSSSLFLLSSIGVPQPPCSAWGLLPTSSKQREAAYLCGLTLPYSSLVISLFSSPIHLLLLCSCGWRWQGWRHMRTLVKSLTKPARTSPRIGTSGSLLPNWRKPMETPRWWRKSLTEPSHLSGLTGWKSTGSSGYRYVCARSWRPRGTLQVLFWRLLQSHFAPGLSVEVPVKRQEMRLKSRVGSRPWVIPWGNITCVLLRSVWFASVMEDK